MTAVPELSLPAADVPVLTVVPAPEVTAEDLGYDPATGTLALFPIDYAAR
jgi:hypothetical protein